MNILTRSIARALPLLSLMPLAPLSQAVVASTPSSNEAILKLADAARGNVSGLSWEVSIDADATESGNDAMVYDIKVRSFNVAGTSLAPAKYRGNKILMLNSSMWFYKPGLSKPVPVSQRQKLMGEAAYGDIASTNYADNYASTRLPDEAVNGEPCYVFDLKAKDEKLTYDRIVYWVSKEQQLGIKADYYTVSGKKFKSAAMDYGNSVKVNGQARPFLSRITLRGELMNGAVTYLNLRNPHLEPIPDYVFDLNLFMR